MSATISNNHRPTTLQNHMIMRTKTTATLLTGAFLFAAYGAFSQAPNTSMAVTSVSMATSATVGQSVTINNTAFVVKAKKELSPGVEFYAVKAATSKATENYIRSNNTFGGTVFSQAQYEAFVASGKMSSFGTVYQYTVDGTTVNYVLNGKVAALLIPDGNGLVIYEFSNDPIVMAKPATGGSSSGATVPKNGTAVGCITRCGSQVSNCRANKPPTVSSCDDQLDECLAACRANHGGAALVLPKPSLHTIVPVLPVKLK